MNKEKQLWKVIAHSYQIADTGDYEGHFEITNGKISLFTNDESDDSDETEDKPYQKVIDALNATNSKFWIDDSWMVELSHYRQSAEELRIELAAKDAEIERLKGIVRKAHDSGYVSGYEIGKVGEMPRFNSAWETFKTANNL